MIDGGYGHEAPGQPAHCGGAGFCGWLHGRRLKKFYSICQKNVLFSGQIEINRNYKNASCSLPQQH